MNLKIVHTKDGRTLYKDLDTGHWVNKKNVPSDVISKLANTSAPKLKKPEYDSNFKYWLDNADGDMGLALQDILYDRVADTWEQGGKEYDIHWDGGRFVKVVKQATPEDPYLEFTADVIVSPAGKDGPTKQMTLKDPITKKPKRFKVQVYKEAPVSDSSDVRDPEKDEQIRKGEEEAKRLNQPKPETIENKYGFEVENKDDPVLSFTDSHWKKMAELKKQGKFYDHDLYDAVRDKITEIVDKYEDLYNYDSDACILRERMDEYGITDSEWWAGWHLLAEWLGLKGKEK